MKKIALLAAAPLLLIGLAACDKKEDKAPETAAPVADSTAINGAPPAQIAPPAPASVVTPDTAPAAEVPADATPTGSAPLTDTSAQTPATGPDGTAETALPAASPNATPSAASPNAETPVKEKN